MNSEHALVQAHYIRTPSFRGIAIIILSSGWR